MSTLHRRAKLTQVACNIRFLLKFITFLPCERTFSFDTFLILNYNCCSNSIDYFCHQGTQHKKQQNNIHLRASLHNFFIDLGRTYCIVCVVRRQVMSVNANSGMFYGREGFRPGKIVTQIATIHIFFYTTFAFMLFVLNHTLGVASIYSLRRTGPLILDQMLAYRALSFRTSPGAAAIFSLCMSSVLCGSFAFVKFVGRSRRALDFSATMMTVHLVCCSLYGGIPLSFLWWVLNGACTVAMTVVCETLSRRVELREIAVPQDIEAQTSESCDIRPA